MEASVATQVPGGQTPAETDPAEPEQPQSEPDQPESEPEQPEAEPEAPEPTGMRGRIVLHSGLVREVQDVERVLDAFDSEEASVLDLVDLSGGPIRVRSGDIALCDSYSA